MPGAVGMCERCEWPVHAAGDGTEGGKPPEALTPWRRVLVKAVVNQYRVAGLSFPRGRDSGR